MQLQEIIPSGIVKIFPRLQLHDYMIYLFSNLMCNDFEKNGTKGPKMIARTHIFIIWEFISLLHRTSGAQGFLAGIILNRAFWQELFCVILAPPQGTFLCTRQLHTLIVWN